MESSRTWQIEYQSAPVTGLQFMLMVVSVAVAVIDDGPRTATGAAGREPVVRKLRHDFSDSIESVL